MDLINWNGAG